VWLRDLAGEAFLGLRRAGAPRYLDKLIPLDRLNGPLPGCWMRVYALDRLKMVQMHLGVGRT
jgi:hypothetical protein